MASEHEVNVKIKLDPTEFKQQLGTIAEEVKSTLSMPTNPFSNWKLSKSQVDGITKVVDSINLLKENKIKALSTDPFANWTNPKELATSVAGLVTAINKLDVAKLNKLAKLNFSNSSAPSMPTYSQNRRVEIPKSNGSYNDNSTSIYSLPQVTKSGKLTNNATEAEMLRWQESNRMGGFSGLNIDTNKNKDLHMSMQKVNSYTSRAEDITTRAKLYGVTSQKGYDDLKRSLKFVEDALIEAKNTHTSLVQTQSVNPQDVMAWESQAQTLRASHTFLFKKRADISTRLSNAKESGDIKESSSLTVELKNVTEKIKELNNEITKLESHQRKAQSIMDTNETARVNVSSLESNYGIIKKQLETAKIDMDNARKKTLLMGLGVGATVLAGKAFNSLTAPLNPIKGFNILNTNPTLQWANNNTSLLLSQGFMPSYGNRQTIHGVPIGTQSFKNSMWKTMTGSGMPPIQTEQTAIAQQMSSGISGGLMFFKSASDTFRFAQYLGLGNNPQALASSVGMAQLGGSASMTNERPWVNKLLSYQKQSNVVMQEYISGLQSLQAFSLQSYGSTKGVLSNYANFLGVQKGLGSKGLQGQQAVLEATGLAQGWASPASSPIGAQMKLNYISTLANKKGLNPSMGAKYLDYVYTQLQNPKLGMNPQWLSYLGKMMHTQGSYSKGALLLQQSGLIKGAPAFSKPWNTLAHELWNGQTSNALKTNSNILNNAKKLFGQTSSSQALKIEAQNQTIGIQGGKVTLNVAGAVGPAGAITASAVGGIMSTVGMGGMASFLLWQKLGPKLLNIFKNRKGGGGGPPSGGSSVPTESPTTAMNNATDQVSKMVKNTMNQTKGMNSLGGGILSALLSGVEMPAMAGLGAISSFGKMLFGGGVANASGFANPTFHHVSFNSPSPSANFNGNPSSFIHKMMPYAIKVQKATGLPANFVLGQWGMESGWGTSTAARANLNFAGIQPWGTRGAGLDKKYAGYSSINSSVQGYINFLEKNPHYKRVLSMAQQGASISQLEMAMAQSGYSTSGSYIKSLNNGISTVNSIVHQSNHNRIVQQHLQSQTSILSDINKNLTKKSPPSYNHTTN